MPDLTNRNVLTPSEKGPPVLVVGKNGQLAISWGNLGPERLHLIGRPELDFDQPATLDKAFAYVQPGLVINAAAWTDVDLAESEPEAAARANRDGPQKLASLCAERHIPLIHISRLLYPSDAADQS